MTVLVIYHSQCPDGFASALTIYKKFVENKYIIDKPEIIFYPGVYQKEIPYVKDYDVYMLDFSYKRPEMEMIKAQAKSFTWIDHHKSAIEDNESLNLTGIRSLNKSGCALTWEYFYPNKPLPELFKYIQDIDLWKFNFPETKFAMHYIYSKFYHFSDWLALFDEFEIDSSNAIEKGKCIYERFEKDMLEILENNRDEMVLGGHKIPVCNAPYMYASEICNALCRVYAPNTFAASYYFKKDGVVFSLRSLNTSDFDVSTIAKLFGGGGHKHSAGFEISKNSFFNMLKYEV